VFNRGFLGTVLQWSRIGAHYLLQARPAALNDELPDYFERWYPGVKISGKTNSNEPYEEFKNAA